MKSLFSTGLFALLFLGGCNWFEYSPNQLILDEDNKNLTQRNLTMIQAEPEKDSLRIAVIGDTQRNYRSTEKFVEDANSRNDIDLMLHTGDITDFGLSQEFNWMGNLLNGCDFPYFTVIGNHDFVTQGEHVYNEMYGPFNYSFEHSRVRFIFLNTNSREFNFNGQVPDLNWLEDQLQFDESIDLAVVVMHVPIFNDDFDPELKDVFVGILEDSDLPVLTVNGHHHNYGFGALPGSSIPYLNTFSIGKDKYILLDIKDSTHSHQIVELP